MIARNYSLYILRCADDTLYTGITTDVGGRLREHEQGTKGAKYLRGRAPLQLVFDQSVGERGVALRLEYRVKQLDRMQKEALIAGEISLLDMLTELNGDVSQASGGSCG